MKFGQLLEYNRELFLVKIHAENEARRLVPGLFCFSKSFI